MLRPPRLCIVSEIFHPEDRGGQGRQAYDLAEYLQASGCHVRVLTRRHYSTSATRERVGNIQVDRLPPLGLTKGSGWRAIAPTFVFLCALLWKLARTARSYDVLIVHGVKTILLPPLLIRGLLFKRVLVKVDASAELDQSITAESLARMGLQPTSMGVRWWTRLRRYLLHRADGIIAICGEIREQALRLGVPRDRIFELPNGIDLSRWAAVTSEEKHALRTRLGLPAGPLFCYVGRLSRAKGVLNLLEAWLSVCSQHPDAQLLIIGTGVGSYDACEDELHRLHRQSRHAGQVIFTGQVENTREYLQACDAFVACSESEGFGLALIEAMACALPCITTPVGAACDVIQPGENGVLVPIGDTAAIAIALQSLLREPTRWTELGAAARAAVMARYDLQQVARCYVQIVEHIGKDKHVQASPLASP